MRTTIKFAMLAFSVSCFTACKDTKSAEHITTTTITESTEYRNGSEQPAEGSTDSRTSRSGAAQNDGNGNSVSNGSNTSNSVSKKKSGYSAPDGTDAENRDGDMYTKHDTTRMPTGVPIK